VVHREPNNAVGNTALVVNVDIVRLGEQAQRAQQSQNAQQRSEMPKGASGAVVFLPGRFGANQVRYMSSHEYSSGAWPSFISVNFVFLALEKTSRKGVGARPNHRFS
jgi:hypothetical protein